MKSAPLRTLAVFVVIQAETALLAAAGAFALVAPSVLLVAPLEAQANANPAIDVRLGGMGALATKGRSGAFPGGTNGLSMATTVCNQGTVNVPWQKAMQSNHPFIGFIMARDDGIRLEQISDRSYVKHGFFALANSQCTPCQGGSPSGAFLGLGCSDTYNNDNNGDRFWLGPPDEIDPWLGTWDPACSHFDRGEPPVAAPQDCDGLRSLTQAQVNALGPVAHRMLVADADLMDGGPERFFIQSHYVVRGELEAKRGDNTGWREVSPTWNGTTWNFANVAPFTAGSVLGAWSGADVASNTNGLDDGRVFVAVKVTGPVQGLYHYEYAVHNRDNQRGVGAFRIPACAETQVLAAEFQDVDGDPSNDWTFARSATELVWSTSTNPIAWNSLFNFSFDSDAAPIDGVALALDAFAPGAGAASIVVDLRAPLGLFNVDLGPGCSNAAPPRIFATGSPPRATLGNTTFAVRTVDNAPGAFVAFVFSFADALADVGGGCFSYVGVGPPLFLRSKATNAQGEAALPLPVPLDTGIEGLHLNLQVLELDPLGGPFLSVWDLSNGLRIRIGDAIASCP